MAVKCPKCQLENPEDSKFCKECGTQFTLSDDAPPSFTKTLETPIEELKRGALFASRYEVIEELGGGGMGNVHRVLDKKINEEVALKLLKPEIAADKKTLERFSNELKLARKIVHKNVGRMYHLGEERGTHFITMEYIHGQDLRGLIRQSGRLAVGTTLNIAKQICEGLAEAHKLGVVHRDLKPSNIMIDKDGHARIMDFGIARSLKAKGITGVGVMIGTPDYMSPEQVDGKETDQRSDIYSLGVILYEMVTGRAPFEGETPLSVAVKHKAEIPEDPKELNTQIPLALSQIILKCMEKNKEKRCQQVEEILSELTKVEEGIPTTERKILKKKPITSKEITVTFGVKKLFYPALIFLALIIIGFIIWQILPRAEDVKASIMVINFENHTGDQSYDHLRKVIPNLLITNLEQSTSLEVTTWERLNDLIRQMGRADTDFIDNELGFELCKMDNIDAIVLGSFAKAGNMFATDVKVLDAETKRLIKSVSSKGEGEGSIIKNQIDELSREISRGIGISRKKIESEQSRVEDVTTDSMEAYTYLLEGKESWYKFRFEDAREKLEKALELDPTFAEAYLYLAQVYRRLGRPIASDASYEKAKEYSHKASEKERLYIEAFYAREVENNRRIYVQILTEITEKYPKEKEAHFLLGSQYRGRGQLDDAISSLEKSLELDPNYGSALNLTAYVYTELKNYEKALEYAEKYASVSPEEPNPLDTIAEIYFMMGRLDEAIAKYEETLAMKPDFGSAWSLAYVYALKENYPKALKWIDHYINTESSPGRKGGGNLSKSFIQILIGQFSQSLHSSQKAVEFAQATKNARPEAFALWLRAYSYFMAGDIELFQDAAKVWLDFRKNFDPENLPFYRLQHLYFLGLLEIKRGQVESIKEKLKEINIQVPRFAPGSEGQIQSARYYALLKAETLLAEGLTDEAIATWEQAPPSQIISINTGSVFAVNIPLIKDVKARAFQNSGELDRAIGEYEELIRIDPDPDDRLLIHPLYHYRLAKLYEEKGWEGKAIDQYQKFLEIWKDADPGIAEVEDARARLASLQ